MLKLSKWLLVVSCPIIIIDQIIAIETITMPVWWTILAGPLMTGVLGVGLIIFSIKTQAFNLESKGN